MKKYKTMVWGILAFQLIILCIIVLTAKVDDMKLSKGDKFDYNYGWTVIREDGSREPIGSLPYNGKSAPDEKIEFENVVPSEFCGKTLTFLASNIIVDIRIEDDEIYSFGKDDVRLIGSSPGDVVVYADIPADAANKKISIILSSPYENLAGCCPIISVGNRDVMILNRIENNYFEMICAFIIFTIGVTALVLSFFLKMTHNNDFGSLYMAVYLMLVGMYHFGETNVLTIFMGNQFLYSNMSDIITMTAPMFFLMYLGYTIPKGDRAMKLLMYLPVLNITIQAVLQMANIIDFDRMELVSHCILIIILLVALLLLNKALGRKVTSMLVTQFVGVMALTMGEVVDFYTSHILKVDDMGKYSRYGAVIFAITGAIVLLNSMVSDQIRFVEMARKDAEKANKAKSQFLANMSHEIRTPINAVLGLDTMILRESKEETIRTYAADIKTAGENLLSLINDILDFSKIESGKMEIIESEYDFGILIHDVMNMITTKASDKGLNMILKLDEELPSVLYGDDVRIRQILVNILTNAVKYTEQGSVTLDVSGRVEGECVYIRYSIKDTGIGIRAEDIEKLFVQFQRIDEQRNKNIEGTGLGMSIASQLLTLMDSKLQINSVYGEGSDFFFELKQKIVNEEPVGDIGIRSANAASEYEYKESFVAPAAKVLVVDDNVMNRNVFRALLKKTKMQIFEASGGVKCIDMCWQEQFNIIFLDHMMPEMDGVETLHKMRSIQNYPNKRTPVIALTANAITGAREKYLEEGFDDFLAKPINPDKLERMIADYLPHELLMTEEEADEWIDDHKGELICQNHIEDQEEIHDDEPFPEIEGVDWNRAMETLRDKSIVISTAKDFARMADSHSEMLVGYYTAKDYEKYRIQVHSMKTSASVIGAAALSDMARNLEFAARDGNIEEIDAKTNEFVEQWNSICADFKREFLENKRKTVPVDYEKLAMYLDALEAAVEQADIDEMDKIADLLKGYSYPDSQDKLVDKLVLAIFNVDYDKCFDLLKVLRGGLK